MRRSLVAAATLAVLVLFVSPATATIHPLVQSIACAAAAARENVAVADPAGQTPDGFTVEIISVDGTILTVAFPTPLTFDRSDFRALQATGFIDEVVTNADGDVTALLVDLTSMPKAASGNGFMHCANAG
jgi:hypothetical protein